ncbi:hypothetical protein QFC22_004296 [Naganishia vaughanmartiniae]|uniref:Uncharacterized protein n=1 Tax=Naganishia vaughanmartiniae TaxID=1424756 RepID=A0ACC2X323_9TREE|nr:hypothetical protein QFC22_004296 [Naganishia vaughanmartiniae]
MEETSSLLQGHYPTKRHPFFSMPVALSRSQRKFVTGVILLLCVVILWTLSNFITSDLLSGGYDKPFLITYLNTSAFSLYLLPFLYNRSKRRRRKNSIGIVNHTTSSYTPVAQRETRNRSPTLPTTRTLRRSNSLIRSASPSPALNLHQQTPHSTPHPTTRSLPPIYSPSVDIDAEQQHTFSSPNIAEPAEAPGHLTKLTSRETAQLAAVFCFAWFAANWSVNASLGLTSVGSSTILAGMSGFFTLGLGRIVGVETFTRAKVLAVLASFIGLLLVTHSDSMISTASTVIDLFQQPSTVITFAEEIIVGDRRPKNPLAGDLLALLSAVCYAVYVILLKVKIEDEERVDMQLFFGFVGLFNTLFLLPVIPILHYFGIETFQLPNRRDEWIICGINMVITLSSDYLYVLSMLKTTPLVVTIGLSLTIPFAMAGDIMRGASATITWQSLTGAALVIVGFGLMGLEGWEEGMANRVPIVAPILTGDEADADEYREEDGESSIFSVESEGVHSRLKSPVVEMGSERYRLRRGSSVTRDAPDGNAGGSGGRRFVIGDS